MRTFAMLLVVAALTVSAQAVIITDPGAGALKMKLVVQADGTAELVNTSGATVSVDGYEIGSAGGNLLPGSWQSIADKAALDPIGVLGALGAGALSFGELTATTTVLAEGSLSGAAAFAAGAPWGIGMPVGGTPSAEDLVFYYHIPSDAPNKYLGAIEVIPEPATLSVAALGALALIRRRRR